MCLTTKVRGLWPFGVVLVAGVFGSTGCEKPANDVALETKINAAIEARVAQITEEIAKAEPEPEPVLDPVQQAIRREAEASVDPELPNWQRSQRFVALLEELMADYNPELPEIIDDQNVLQCVTRVSFDTDRGLTEASRVLAKDVADAKRQVRRLEQQFERRRYLQYRIDFEWEKRVATKQTRRCFDRDYWGWAEDDYDCTHWNNREWRVINRDDFGVTEYDQSGQHLYNRDETPAPPELMKRLTAANVSVPERFYCRVEEVSRESRAADSAQLVVCEKGSRESSARGASRSWRTLSLRIMEPTQTLNIGDIVSVPLAGVNSDPAGVLYRTARTSSRGHDSWSWRIEATGDTLVIENAASCPDLERIALTAIDKLPANRRNNAPLVDLMRRAEPKTVEGKAVVADDHARNRRWKQAADIYEELGNVDKMLTAARGLATARQTADAVAVYRKVIATRNEPGLLFELGELELAAGESEQGLARLLEALPGISDTRKVLAALGHFTRAEDEAGATQARARACELGHRRSCTPV